MIRYLFILAAVASSLTSHAQVLSQAALDTVWNFMSLEEALKKPEQVVKLTLRKSKLSEVPPEVFTHFPNLQILDLSKNRLKLIPAAIGQLNYLQELDLGANQIEALPDEICELQHLRILSAGRNEIAELPVNIGNLKSLEYLDLWSNNLSALPNSASDLTNLKVLDLRVIQLSKITQEQIAEQLPGVTIHFSAHCNCD